MPALTSWGHLGAVTLATVLHVEPWLVIALFAELTLLTFYLLEHGPRDRHSRENTANHGSSH